jgi:dTDP-glucose 4,6-dehydratase
MTRVLVTGGAGFIGHHLIECLLKNTDWDIVVWDKLNYSGRLDRLRDVSAFNESRVLILTCDFASKMSEGIVRETGDVNYIIHLGAESHVDRSISDPEPFVVSNVLGTMNVLNYARDNLSNLKCFYFFSTDEVFGPAPDGVNYCEGDPHNPSNPYAATKSGAEMLVKSYRNTYKLPAVITRTMNVFGERQHAEKYIPTVIKKVLRGEKVTIHADSTKTRAGSRYYIHARNVSDGLLFLVSKNSVGEDYHIVGEKEVDNLSLARLIADILGKSLDFELVDFHSSRPGHDLRYALSGEKLREFGWVPPKNFEESLEKTVYWTLENSRWLEM